MSVPTRPVFARHAASLLLWRRGVDGTEVLMGVRGAGHRFMPNKLVFPGGAVDAVDRTSAAAAEPDPRVLEVLGRTVRPKLARAIVAAAARELQEETGLSLGTPPHLDQIGYLCRAVTPPRSPIRFNARFLVAPAEAASGTLADSGELQHVGFYKIADAVGLGLMGVTREVLLRLDPFLGRDPDAAAEYQVYKRQVWIAERGIRAAERIQS